MKRRAATVAGVLSVLIVFLLFAWHHQEAEPMAVAAVVLLGALVFAAIDGLLLLVIARLRGQAASFLTLAVAACLIHMAASDIVHIAMWLAGGMTSGPTLQAQPSSMFAVIGIYSAGMMYFLKKSLRWSWRLSAAGAAAVLLVEGCLVLSTRR